MVHEKDFNNIEGWLKPQLEDMGLSVEQFADKAGLSRASVYFYFQDKTRPNSTAMKRMCDVLGRPFEEGLAQYTPRKPGPRPK